MSKVAGIHAEIHNTGLPVQVYRHVKGGPSLGIHAEINKGLPVQVYQNVKGGQRGFEYMLKYTIPNYYNTCVSTCQK